MTIQELLQKLGVTDDNIASATQHVNEFLDGQYVTKSRFNEVNVEKKTLEEAVKERDKQLKTLKDSEGNVDDLKEQIKKLQAENKVATVKAESDMKALRLSTAIKLAIGDTAQDVDLVANLVDTSKLILSDDGKVTGLDEQIKVLKTEKSFLFKPDGDPKYKYEPKQGEGAPKNNPFSQEHFNLTKQAELFTKDPVKAKQLASEAGVEINF
ncbi:MAG: phage scaffolding protein [Veillonella sp. oral taxon 780]|jgi:hypothetical protein|nr:phage scaffolding protein [Veillonella sp. oral taxon 780]DAO32355.1 MAG TPA: minor structural protein [Caudoviricetes sp.]